MAYQYPPTLAKLINELSRLPGLGPKAAQRLAFFLLTEKRQACGELARALLEAESRIHPCPICGNLTDSERCAICADGNRDRSLLCIVESVGDILSLERSQGFSGVYHVLGGVISPLDGIGPEKLNLTGLEARVRENHVTEIIMATNPTVEGEATALYLAKKLKPLGVKVSRLAHGMPVGGNLTYADEATLSLALAGRKEL